MVAAVVSPRICRGVDDGTGTEEADAGDDLRGDAARVAGASVGPLEAGQQREEGDPRRSGCWCAGRRVCSGSSRSSPRTPPRRAASRSWRRTSRRREWTRCARSVTGPQAPPPPLDARSPPTLATMKSRFIRAMFSTLISLGRRPRTRRCWCNCRSPPRPSARPCAARGGRAPAAPAAAARDGDLRGDEQHGGGVRTRGHARAAADAGGGVHGALGVLLRDGNGIAVRRAAGRCGDEAAAAMMRSNALRSTTRSRMTGKAAARHGSMGVESPSLKLRM